MRLRKKTKDDSMRKEFKEETKAKNLRKLSTERNLFDKSINNPIRSFVLGPTKFLINPTESYWNLKGNPFAKINPNKDMTKSVLLMIEFPEPVLLKEIEKRLKLAFGDVLS